MREVEEEGEQKKKTKQACEENDITEVGIFPTKPVYFCHRKKTENFNDNKIYMSDACEECAAENSEKYHPNRMEEKVIDNEISFECFDVCYANDYEDDFEWKRKTAEINNKEENKDLLKVKEEEEEKKEERQQSITYHEIREEASPLVHDCNKHHDYENKGGGEDGDANKNRQTDKSKNYFYRSKELRSNASTYDMCSDNGTGRNYKENYNYDVDTCTTDSLSPSSPSSCKPSSSFLQNALCIQLYKIEIPDPFCLRSQTPRKICIELARPPEWSVS